MKYWLAPALIVTLCAAFAVAADPVSKPAEPDAGQMEMWLWSYGMPQQDFYKEIGFTSAGGPTYPHSPSDEDAATQMKTVIRPVMEEVQKAGMHASVAPQNGISRTNFILNPPKGDDVDYLGATRNGERYYNPFNPQVAALQNQANELLMKSIKDFANLKFVFDGMEEVDDLTEANENKEGLARMKRMLGFAKQEVGEPKFIAPGVIADNDRAYLYRKYVWTGGNGVSAVLQRAGEMVHRYRPDVKVISDPYRSVAFYNVYPKDIDVVESWTYTNPDPKAMFYVETLRAACKPLHQTPLQVVSLLTYPGTILPKKIGWSMAEPDVVKESIWINLSRAPQMVGIYYSSECDPVKFASPADQIRVPHATSMTIKEMSDKVIKPLGALIKQMEVSPRKIAVLSSEAARVGNKSRALLGYPNQQIYQFYTVMAMAHLNADVLFDESILNGDLDQYEVLVLPKCDALLKTEVDKIRAFQKRGGLVIADQYLGPNLPGAMRFNFDFDYRQKVNAEAIATGKMIADMGADDHLDPHNSKVMDATGVTAEMDQKIMESYAAELKKRLHGKVIPAADCDNPTVLLNMTQHKGVQYLFVINDKRTYSERTGPYKATLGKLVPQETTVQLNEWGDKPLYAFDLLKHQALKVDGSGKSPRFRVNLDEVGGTLVALRSDQPTPARAEP